MLALSQTAGYVLVGVIASIIPLGSAYLAFRANREATKVSGDQRRTETALDAQGSLIDDLKDDRDDLRQQLADVKAQVIDLRLKHEECERQRQVQAVRIRELEAR